MKMSSTEHVHIVMEKVDLGGHPHVAFFDETKAVEECVFLNREAVRRKIDDLKAGCNYTQEQAEAWVSSYSPFYVETVEVK